MNPYYNLPPHQRATQRLADDFNAAERLWESLAGRRRLRRQLRPKLSKEQHRKLNCLEFERARTCRDYPPIFL